MAGGADESLVAEAARRSRVCWLSYRYVGDTGPDEVRDRLVWHVWHDDAVVVLSCPRAETLAEGADRDAGESEEQVLPGLAQAERATVTMRSKDTRGRLLTWSGTVEVVPPGSEAWPTSAAALLGVRLNLPDPESARRVWADRGTVVRIRPVPDAGRAAGNEELGALP